MISARIKRVPERTGAGAAIPPNAALVFEVELVSFDKAPTGFFASIFGN